MESKTSDELIREWNEAGRDFMGRLNAVIADAREGRPTPDDWPKEPRNRKAAEAIMALVETAEREGRWRADCPIADRALEPFSDGSEGFYRNLNCVTILGPDEFLVCLRGSPPRSRLTVHLRGGDISELPGVLAMAASRNHELLVLVRENGFAVSRGLDTFPIRRLPWPEGVSPMPIDCLQLSNDGLTIAFVEHDTAVWLGQVSGAATVWTRVHPGKALLTRIAQERRNVGPAARKLRVVGSSEETAEETFNEGDYFGSMMHCALSADGRFIAHGSQRYGHFIDQIEGVGTLRQWAEIGRCSAYPHYAWFSDDSASAALRAFYALICLHSDDSSAHATLLDTLPPPNPPKIIGWNPAHL